jgi:hypothetical protein
VMAKAFEDASAAPKSDLLEKNELKLRRYIQGPDSGSNGDVKVLDRQANRGNKRISFGYNRAQAFKRGTLARISLFLTEILSSPRPIHISNPLLSTLFVISVQER